MSPIQQYVVGMFLLGVACLGVAAALTIVGWRKDAPPGGYYYGLGSGLAIHPERYVRQPFLRVVRVLSFIGALLVCLASLAFVASSMRMLLR